MRQMSPFGFEITPDIEAEAFADPTRIPASLQTPDWKQELLTDLASSRVGDRHRALSALGGWDADPEVATALRPLLASEDAVEAGMAADALSRQRFMTDLPALVDLVHRMSPADGGTTDSMVMPLQAALRLAEAAGPEIASGLRVRARAWRGEASQRRERWQEDLDVGLDELLRDPDTASE
ncbi:hypothetical protein BH20CHL7_BH20CHL7_00590 [soil metagenome]